MSTLVNKKIAVANVSDIRMRRMPKQQLHPLAELIAQRVDEGVVDRLTYDEVERRSGGRISASYVNELRNGKKDPSRLRVDKIIGLAKGLGESPVVVFEAAIGLPHTQLRDKTVEQLLADFMSLSSHDRNDPVLRYAYNQFHEKVQEKLNRNP